MKRLNFAHYLMITPVQLLLVCFLFAPALYVFYLSLTNYSYGTETSFVGLANYQRVLSDPIFWQAAINTFILVNVVVAAELALGLGLAVLMAGWVPAKRVVVSLLLVPYAITEVTAVVMWRFMLEPDVGMINWGLQQMLGFQIDWATDRWQALFVIALLSIWLTLPFTFLILYSAVTTVSRDLMEASRIDGGNRWQTFWYVTLPTITPAVLVAVMFRYIFAMRLFSEVWLFTQGGPANLTEVLATYLYRNGFRYQDFGLASASGWIMIALSMVLASYYLYQLYRQLFRNA
ncbi:MAG TPA: sugar ABC transporter permease [Devosiaceae bacterium]|jgi:multiple sugar transport system permease protein